MSNIIKNIGHLNISLSLSPIFGAEILVHGLAIGEEVDYEAQNSLPALNLILSTKLHLSTEPPLLGRCC